MHSERREALAQRVLSFCEGDESEVSIYADHSELTRFTHNAVHQNVSSEDVTVRIRAVVDGRTGVAASNILDDEHLREAAHRALEMAKLAPRDPERPPMQKGSSSPPPANPYSEATAGATPAQRAHMCDHIFKVAQEHGLWCAGFVRTGTGGFTIVNSAGTRDSFDSTDSSINVKMNGSDSSGFAEQFDRNVEGLNAGEVASRAADKANQSANPVAVEPGPWTVIMEPVAFGEILMYLTTHFSAQSFAEGSSFLSGELGNRILSENVTILDDYCNVLSPGAPFDYEGIATQRVTLIDSGVARDVVTDSYWARKLGRPNTGHALPAPNAWGPQARHLTVATGKKSAEQLIAETEKGLLITRFWYIRTVDDKKAIVTGMTRDGTFLIENGQLKGGVRNMRFNHSIINALQNVEFGNAAHRTGGYSYDTVVPAAKITGFTFSSGTDF